MTMPNHELLALIERIREQDKEVRAWRAFPDENALNTAPNGEFADSNGPLTGLTVGVKDIIDVAGIPTRHGSPIYENAAPASVDAACVSLMRAAGATIVGKTVTTELATFVPSVTRNPRNLNHTPGGSSSGSAAAVAAGHVDIAIGTQTAGSIIRPAAYCGVFGFKPSFGLVPRAGVKIQSETLDTVGVFANSIEHCEAWLAAMLQQPLSRSLVSQPTAQPLRIAIITNKLEFATEDMRATILRAGRALADAGHHLCELALQPPLFDLHEQQTVIQHYESARAYYLERTQHRAQLTPALAGALDQGAAISVGDYMAAQRAAERGRIIADELFADSDAWIMPAAPGRAPCGLTSTGDPTFNRLASILRVPAVSIPYPFDGSALHMGLQIVGGRNADMPLLQAARALVSHFKIR